MFDLYDAILNFIMGRFVYCPRCLTRLPLRSEVGQDLSCSHCQYLIPLAYITCCQQAPPVFVQIFGLPGSGKTTFLNALGLLLQHMDHVWQESEYYCRPLTQRTMEHTTTLLNRSNAVVPIESTPRRSLAQAEVFIFSLCKMPRWGSRTMVMMDHAGEQFAGLDLDLADIPFLQHTPITILLLSLDDLAHAGKRIDDPITTYLRTLDMHNADPTGQHRQLIIALSKADLLPDLPSELGSYLSNDTSGLPLISRQGHASLSGTQLSSYLQQMQHTSGAIRSWVETTLPNGRSMLNMLDHRKVDTCFTLISATGGPPSTTPDGEALVPRPRRVLDPFFWMLEYSLHWGRGSTVPATLPMVLATFSPALRSRWSLLLLALLFTGSLSASLFLARLNGGTPDLVRPGLSLLALLIYILAAQWLTRPGSVPDPSQTAPPAPVARSVLNTSRLALVLACLTSSAAPAVLPVLTHLTAGQFLQMVLVGFSLFSCFQPTRRMALLSRITLILIAGCGALLQYSYGVALELQTMHLFASPETYHTINNCIILVLLLLAGAQVLILTTERNHWDRLILWLVTPVFAGLQLVYGPWELSQIFAQMNHVETANIILTGLVVLVPLSVLISLYRFTVLDRLPLVILACVCAIHLHFLGDGALLPSKLLFPGVAPDGHLLANSLVSLLTPGRLLIFVLLLLVGLMTVRGLSGRTPGTFAFLDHATLFFLALLCFQFQASFQGAPVPQGALAPFQNDLLIANHLVEITLLPLLSPGVCLALFLLLLPLVRPIRRLSWLLRPLTTRMNWLTRQPWYRHGLLQINTLLARLSTARSHSQTVYLTQGNTWLRSMASWSRRALTRFRSIPALLDGVMRILERLLACTTALACALLADLYGQFSPDGSQPVAIAEGVSINQLGAALCVLLAVIILLRIRRPFTRIDRFLLLLPLSLCLWFSLDQSLPPHPLVITLQNWDADTFSNGVSILLFVGLCAIATLLSFWWAERSPFPGDRRLLHILFVLALTGDLFQLLSPTFLPTLLALQALVMGIAIAALGARARRAGSV